MIPFYPSFRFPNFNRPKPYYYTNFDLHKNNVDVAKNNQKPYSPNTVLNKNNGFFSNNESSNLNRNNSNFNTSNRKFNENFNVKHSNFDNFNVKNSNFDNFDNFETKKNSSNVNDENGISEQCFDFFGLKLYFDDLLIIALLFTLYQEEVKDNYLYIALIMLLLS